jgi:SAM-dependent methyltransferase
MPAQPALTPSEYARCFEVLKASSREHEVTSQWFASQVAPCLDVSDTLRIMSIGSGPGDFDELLILAMPMRGYVEYNFVENHPGHLEALRRCTEALQRPGFSFNIHQNAFTSATQMSGKFDVIIMAHFLYYVPDREAVIANAKSHLSERGVLIIIHQTALGINQVQRYLSGLIGGNLSESVCSGEIRKITGALVIDDIIPTGLDVTDIIENKRPEGDLLLSFFIESRIQNLDSSIVARLRQFISDLSYTRDQRNFLFHPVGVMVAANDPSIALIRHSTVSKKDLP